MRGDDDEERDHDDVLTSRRAWLRHDGGVLPCRLRLTETRLELAPTAADAAFTTVALGDVVTVRTVGPLRSLVEVATAEATVRFRCFGAPAVVGLISGAVARGR